MDDNRTRPEPDPSIYTLTGTGEPGTPGCRAVRAFTAREETYKVPLARNDGTFQRSSWVVGAPCDSSSRLKSPHPQPQPHLTLSHNLCLSSQHRKTSRTSQTVNFESGIGLCQISDFVQRTMPGAKVAFGDYITEDADASEPTCFDRLDCFEPYQF